MDICILDEDDALEAMKQGLLRFNNLLALGKETEANIYITGVHHALVEYHRSQTSLSDRIQARWHTWRAFDYASKVNLNDQKNPDHIYTLATALMTAPRWMGGNKHRRAVEKMLQDVLRPGGVGMDDDLRTLLLRRLGEIKNWNSVK